MTCLFSCEQ
ncbi:URF 1 [Escherichia coli]|uniref:URF 1 n=1 Tax=Escherichia coli TaxID=562 RepID=Q47063_ECOLX|nr:unnamed protein product [Escherichia coli]CAI4145524.1 URF 1 [Escherichia coli]CAI6160797.1 URF 1 [Escherichia coli]CAI6167048.1 URF 1 [Escherichia coli]CAI6180226.1 URF 1 [Escherichia coli]